MNEIASAHGIHVNRCDKNITKMKTNYRDQIENLYAETGQLTTQFS